MTVDIITPESTLYSGEAKSVVLPGISGSLGVLNNHAPLITALKKGTLKVTSEKGEVLQFDIKGGMVEVSKNKMTVLAE